MTEICEAIRFPVALSGTRTGVHRVLPPYKNAVLARRRLQLLSSPTYVRLPASCSMRGVRILPARRSEAQRLIQDVCLSVRLSVRHTRDPRLPGTRSRLSKNTVLLPENACIYLGVSGGSRGVRWVRTNPPPSGRVWWLKTLELHGCIKVVQ